MVTHKVSVPNQVVDYLERLAYEVDGMKRIIKELITENVHNADILESETFKKYNSRYEEKSAAYEIAKEELIRNHIPQEVHDSNHLFSWNLDFSTGILSYVTLDSEGK